MALKSRKDVYKEVVIILFLQSWGYEVELCDDGSLKFLWEHAMGYEALFSQKCNSQQFNI